MTTQKTAAVTGSSRGIGKAIAKALAAEGYRVILSATGDCEKAMPLLQEFRDAGYDADYIPCNIAERNDRIRFFEWIKEKYGRLDAMVNNAGVAPLVRMDLLETTEESFDRLMQINLKGTFFMCQEAAKTMLTCRRKNPAEYQPRIVNIASVSSYTSSVNRGEYCISKAGISMTTQLFADRLAGEGIPVFEVRPGIILTDMTAKVADKYQKMIAEGLTPIRRFGQPEDVADCVLAALSGRLDFATGQVLNADGGFQIRRL
jgi:3-oxoacyl-[acyl-carrier protein] reductase